MRLRIGDPAVEVALAHRQRARGDAAAAGEVGQVGADAAAGGRPGDVVAHAALALRHIIIAGVRERRCRGGRRPQLLLPPFDEVGVAVDVDDERHVRVLVAAKFGALAAKDADLAGRCVMSFRGRDKVLLAGQARHPEAVDHVVRAKDDPHRNSDGQVQLVRRAQRSSTGRRELYWTSHHHWLRGDGDRQFLMRGGLGHRAVGEEACDRERDQAGRDQRAPADQAGAHQRVGFVVAPGLDDIRLAGAAAPDDPGDQEGDDQQRT